MKCTTICISIKAHDVENSRINATIWMYLQSRFLLGAGFAARFGYAIIIDSLT